MFNRNIGSRQPLARPVMVNPSQDLKLQINQINLGDLQQELGRSRIVEAALTYMSEVAQLNPDFDPAAMFDLSFGLKF